ncbi:MAG: alanyl-tRNA editing protein [Deltaproteobacteria bacterium]|nr:alanyl-tRNA editing protein [Deltaproteobacteria bacterium]
MTIKLYQTKEYDTDFSTKIDSVETADTYSIVTFSETLFYPTGGGQNCDTGELIHNNFTYKVVDVFRDKSTDIIFHKVEKFFPRPGDSVFCRINWDRRFRYMQWHTSQHLLSQAFIRINPLFKTVSVSFNTELCTMDIEGFPKGDDLVEVEKLVNLKCSENLKIEAITVKDEDLKKLPVRRPPKVSGEIRLIKIGDWELAGCGAPHLSSTAQVMLIKIIKHEKIKGNLTRIYFMSGLSAIEDYSQKHNLVRNISMHFSTGSDELMERFNGFVNAFTKTAAQLKTVSSELGKILLEDAIKQAFIFGAGRLATITLSGERIIIAKEVIRSFSTPDVILLLLSIDQENVTAYLVGGHGIKTELNKLVAPVISEIGGKGGGRPQYVQFSFNKKEIENFKSRFMNQLKSIK